MIKNIVYKKRLYIDDIIEHRKREFNENNKRDMEEERFTMAGKMALSGKIYDRRATCLS
jgi:hypothetical protein